MELFYHCLVSLAHVFFVIIRGLEAFRRVLNAPKRDALTPWSCLGWCNHKSRTPEREYFNCIKAFFLRLERQLRFFTPIPLLFYKMVVIRHGIGDVGLNIAVNDLQSYDF